MFVTKRDGRKEKVHFDKITERIARLIAPQELRSLRLSQFNLEDEIKNLDPVIVAQKVVASLFPGITTEQLDIESAQICANMATTHPSYSYLGGRILIANLHKKTLDNYSDKIEILYNEAKNIDKEYYDYIMTNKEEINKMMVYERDYIYDYFGFKTLEKSYLMRTTTNIIERPQDMLMRTAITLQKGNLNMIKITYDMMSLGYYTHASPTLFNAMTNNMQLSSCFLLGIDDSLDSITETWNSCAQISKWAGGIGLHVSNIRAKDSLIKGTGGLSNGLVKFLQVFNHIARWIDQGGKRPGSIAIYLEPHHADIFEFLDLRKNFGAETERARDLFQALWISDLFMKQVDVDGEWYLMSPDDCPDLNNVFGDEFDKLYWSYVSEGKYKQKIEARKLWMAILETQIETGMPYMLYKDAINKKSNQKNIGIIRSSNLCAEIAEYSDDKEYAVCNLASISLKAFVKPFINDINNKWVIYSKPNCLYCKYVKNYLTNLRINYKEVNFTSSTVEELKNKLNTDKITYPQVFLNDVSIGGWSETYKYIKGTFDYDKLYEVAYTATLNLDKVIDLNYYPVPQTRLSNMKNRPIGLGIQGLADTLSLLKIPYDSNEAVEFNSLFMETIYRASISASIDNSKSRYEGIRKMIYYTDHMSLPEYYDRGYKIDDEYLNDVYHTIKPNKWDLQTNPETTHCGAYYTFKDSPFASGKFQFDMWNIEPLNNDKWLMLREEIKKYGIRNSLLTSLMPTASTSQIMGNNECFEYFTNNIYSRKTHAGNFTIVNKYLVSELINVGLWSQELKDKIIAYDGSVLNVDIPEELKQQYKTIWEIGQIWSIKASLARAMYVDQTQSLNAFMAEPDYKRLTDYHFYGWRNGIKTGMYYLRSKPSTGAIKFTIDPTIEKNIKKKEEDEGCLNCSA